MKRSMLHEICTYVWSFSQTGFYKVIIWRFLARTYVWKKLLTSWIYLSNEIGIVLCFFSNFFQIFRYIFVNNIWKKNFFFRFDIFFRIKEGRKRYYCNCINDWLIENFPDHIREFLDIYRGNIKSIITFNRVEYTPLAILQSKYPIRENKFL